MQRYIIAYGIMVAAVICAVDGTVEVQRARAKHLLRRKGQRDAYVAADAAALITGGGRGRGQGRKEGRRSSPLMKVARGQQLRLDTKAANAQVSQIFAALSKEHGASNGKLIDAKKAAMWEAADADAAEHAFAKQKQESEKAAEDEKKHEKELAENKAAKLKEHVLISPTEKVVKGADGKEHELDLSKTIIPPLLHPTSAVVVRHPKSVSNVDEVRNIVRQEQKRADGAHLASHPKSRIRSRIRSSVLRALDAYDSKLMGSRAGLSLSALAGAEVVGDATAMAEASKVSASSLYSDFSSNDMQALGTGDRIVGNITVNGEKVPVYVYEGDRDGDNITIMGIGDVAIGNLSASRTYIRLLTCAQVASVHNQVLQDEENEVEICRFVHHHCKPRGGLINYLELPYCLLDQHPFAGGLLLIFWASLLFVWLTAQVPFLIPSLSAMSKICNMTHTVAGVTFLAFGNGCADLFSMLAATLSGPGGMELAIGEVLGNGMFVFCAVQGSIALVAPFHVHHKEYLRDCFFYFLSIVGTGFVLLDGKIVMLEGLVLFFLYVTYVLIVIYYDKFLKMIGSDPLMVEKGDGDDASSTTSSVQHCPADEEKRQQEALRQYNRLLDSSDSPIALIAHFLVPFEWEYFSSLPWYEMVHEVVKAPVVVLLKLTIPIVDMNLPNEGWIRPVVALQMFCFPFLLTCFTLWQELVPAQFLTPQAYEIIWAACLFSSVGGATLVWVFSEGEKPPAFGRWVAFAGFAAALIWIYTTAKEIVNVILAFGVVFQVGSLILGVTILAIGIGMQDLVTCVGVARAGFPAMAASACVGSSLMNILVGIGVSGVLGPMLVQDPYRLYISVQLLCCLCFMLLSILMAILSMAAFNWQAGRFFGASLVGLYALFIVVSVLIGLFGADVGNSLIETTPDTS